jgi:hypothetical protein
LERRFGAPPGWAWDRTATADTVALEEWPVEHGVALLSAELLGPGRVDAAVHAGGERAALETVAADLVAVETGLAARLLTIRATVPASIARAPTTGEGPSAGWSRVGGTQMRPNTAPR